MPDISLPTARDWMFPSPFTLTPDVDLFDAMDRLVEAKVPAAPVIDENDCLLGMLTEKDCLRVLSKMTYDVDHLEGGTVADYQSPIRVVVEPEMDLFRVAEKFLATNFPILPVVDDCRLLGLISRQGALQGIRAFRREVQRIRGEFETVAGRQADRPRGIETLQRVFAASSAEQLVRIFGRKS